MKQLYRYVAESEDLKQSRQKDEEAYREFVVWETGTERRAEMEYARLWWRRQEPFPILPFSNLYDAPRAA